MSDDKNKLSLKTKWANFWNVMADPWVVFLLTLTIIFIVYSTKSTDKNILAILTLIITLLAGLLGGVVANRWAQMTELKVLVARGKSAIRSLKLVLLNISNIEKRTKNYIDCLDKENKEYKLVTNNFQEVIEKCDLLEEEIISSIENWTDIIPEVANLKTQIGLVSEMKIREAALEMDIAERKKEIQALKDKEGRQNDDLQRILAKKEEELSTTKERLKAAENKINTSVLSGLTGSYTPLITGTTPLVGQCGKCGGIFMSSGINFDGLCDNCRGGNTGVVVGTIVPNR